MVIAIIPMRPVVRRVNVPPVIQGLIKGVAVPRRFAQMSMAIQFVSNVLAMLNAM